MIFLKNETAIATLQGQILFRTGTFVHDGMNDRYQEHRYNTACKTVIIEVHTAIHNTNVQCNGRM